MAKRPNILKLATKISLESMTYTGITYNDPEYKILEPIIDDEMCAIMMHLRLEANRTVEDVAKRAKQSVEYTQTQLDKLAKTGAVRYRYVDGKRCYFYPIWVPGIMEGILANREQCDKYPVLGESFEAYTRRRPEMLAPMLDSGKTGMFFMRVMPVMSAIENDTRTASYDELKTLIENATAISVGPCSCRRARRLMGEGCGHLEEDMCMYLNDNAVCYSEQGYHRLVTKEEAYEILRRAEDNGLVHEINQTPGFEDATAICNCCGCSCFALRIEELFRRDDLKVLVATSAFGEGVDIPNIRHVVLYHLPFSDVEFNQMSGRAGRDGKPAWVHLLYGRGDASINERILADATPDHDVMAQVYRKLRSLQRNTPDDYFCVADADLAEAASDAFRAVSPTSAACGLAVFRELGLIETRTVYEAGRPHLWVRVREGASKVELTDSVRYREGIDERTLFGGFCRWALGTDEPALTVRLCHPIVPRNRPGQGH